MVLYLHVSTYFIQVKYDLRLSEIQNVVVALQELVMIFELFSCTQNKQTNKSFYQGTSPDSKGVKKARTMRTYTSYNVLLCSDADSTRSCMHSCVLTHHRSRSQDQVMATNYSMDSIHHQVLIHTYTRIASSYIPSPLLRGYFSHIPTCVNSRELRISVFRAQEIYGLFMP